MFQVLTHPFNTTGLFPHSRWTNQRGPTNQTQRVNLGTYGDPGGRLHKATLPAARLIAADLQKARDQPPAWRMGIDPMVGVFPLGKPGAPKNNLGGVMGPLEMAENKWVTGGFFRRYKWNYFTLLIAGSGWWFQKIFCFHPEPWGDDPIWLAHICQMGWNHQLDNNQLDIGYIPFFLGLPWLVIGTNLPMSRSFFRPLRMGLWDPFQMAELHGL